MPTPTQTQASPPPPRSRSRSCLIAAGVVVLLLLLAGALVAALLFWRFRTLRHEFSDPGPTAVPVEATTPETARRLERAVEAFQRAVEEGRAERFVFTAEQLNQMVAAVPAVAEARGKAHFTIVDDQLKVTAGIPLDDVPGFAGRYLNGDFTLDLAMENGQLRLRVLDAVVHGKPLDPALLNHLRTLDLGAQAMQNAEVRRQLTGVKALRVEGGKLLVETGRP